MPKTRIKSLFLESWQNSTIFSLLPGEDAFLEWKPRIEAFLREESKGVKLSGNYDLNNFKWDDYALITLETAGEQILTFATALERSKCFPKSSVRICNRFLKSSRVKRFWGRTARQRTVAFIDEQIRALQSLNAGYNYFFISRQLPSGTKFMEHLTNDILNVHSEFKTWTLEPDLCLVCADRNSSSCWQIVTGLNLSGENIHFSARIPKHQWKAKFSTKA